MHAVREAQVVWFLKSWWAIRGLLSPGLPGLALGAALVLSAPRATAVRGAESGAASEGKDAGGGVVEPGRPRSLQGKPMPVSGESDGKKVEEPKDAKVSKASGGPGKTRIQKKPPASVPLPPAAGEYPAEEILPLAGKLMGRTVRVENQRVRDTKVEISADLAGAGVSLDELVVLLAAHKLYLFPVMDPEEGPIVVVSKDPQWREEPPRYTTVIQVAPEDFRAAVAKLNKVAAERNSRLPPREEGMVVVASERTGKIFVRSSRKEDLGKASAVVGKKVEKDPARPRLYTYQGAYRRIEDLRDELLEELKEADRARLHVVIGSRGNRMYYRCPADLGEKVKTVLENLDKPPQGKPAVP